MTTAEILGKLSGVRKSGKGWVASCPVEGHKHGDRKQSLSMSIGEDGRVLLNCHGALGHTAAEICTALGIKVADLFPSNGHGSSGESSNGAASRIVATYDFLDESGKLLFQEVRFDPKNFKMRRPDGKGGWIWNLTATRRVLYRFPELLKTDFVLICEGPKDCETARKLELVATTNPNGAQSPWLPEYAQVLHGKRVAIIPDADESGRKHAQQIAASLAGKVASLKLLELPGAKDLSEWITGMGTDDPRAALLSLIDAAPEGMPVDYMSVFDTFDSFEHAPPMSCAIENFLENNAITAIAGLSDHGKTLAQLSIAKALLAGPPAKLWGVFPVLERAERAVYLIPEVTIPPFKHRLKIMGLYEHLRSGRLLVRTLNKGPAPELYDPRILFAAKGAHVFLDTIVRFLGDHADENAAGDNARGIAKDLFGLLEAEARGVTFAAHSPKAFGEKNQMTLENALRGTGDVGAMVAQCFGLRQIDKEKNIIHVETLKARDLELPPQPFQLIGRPNINETGDFGLYRAPGDCGALCDYFQRPDKGGAPQETRAEAKRRRDLAVEWLTLDRNLPVAELHERFERHGIKVSKSAVKNYRRDAFEYMKWAKGEGQ